MRVFVAGATGAIGKQLVPRLVAAGHEVHGMTRSASKQAMLYQMGAEPVVADALQPDEVAAAVGKARPDVIVDQLTAIGELDMRHFDRAFALTNRLRTEGTDYLLSAGQAVGVKRFVAQSYFATYARTGGPVKSEEDPIDSSPPREMRESVAAIRHLEEAGLAPATIDRRISAVCGFYRFAHIDGVIASNPAQYVRRPRIHPSQARGLDRGELAAFLLAAERFDHAHAALAVLLGLNGLRVSEACSANIEELGFERGHRTLRIIGKVVVSSRSGPSVLI